ncbi:YicS family protein [Pantoea sp. C2G6]|uniref:YicS family protein n=1 Tax=Pantoea sp. C2G6 TaxID=3243084 RepID=UPI003ED85C07
MNVIRHALLILLFSAPLLTSAAPYETLRFALRQQQIVQDLRQKCQLPPELSDEALRQLFLNDEQNKASLIAAAQALKNQDKPAYRERIAQVVCPPHAS